MFYHSKCSEYKKDLSNVEAKLEELHNSMRTKENEWRLEKSSLEVCKSEYTLTVTIMKKKHAICSLIYNFRVKYMIIKCRIKLS